MSKSTGATVDVVGFLVEGIPALSQSAKEFVRQRPREARLAVAVALGLRPRSARGKTVAPLACRRSCGPAQVSRTTVYDWVAKKVLLAWRSTKRGLSIPAAQILGPSRVVPGLAEVVESVGDPELA